MAKAKGKAVSKCKGVSPPNCLVGFWTTSALRLSPQARRRTFAVACSFSDYAGREQTEQSSGASFPTQACWKLEVPYENLGCLPQREATHQLNCWPRGHLRGSEATTLPPYIRPCHRFALSCLHSAGPSTNSHHWLRDIYSAVCGVPPSVKCKW